MTDPTVGRRRSKLPYLHRNWVQVTNYWDAKMGNKVSTEARDGPGKPFDHDAQFQRAAKRRRISNDFDGFPLFEDYANASRALRIEVLKIFHKDSARRKNGPINGISNGQVVPNVKDIVHVKARCKLTISSCQAGRDVILHVDSQVCDLKIFKATATSSPRATFASIKPFHVPQDKIYLEREDDAMFGLAKIYTVNVELESAGDPNWPPFEIMSPTGEDALLNGLLPARQWTLTATISNIFNPRHRNEVQVRVRQAHQVLDTDFRIDIDVRWLTAMSSQLVARALDKEMQQSITVFDPNEPLQPVVNGTANGINGVHAINGVNGVDVPEVPVVDIEVDKSPNTTNGASPDQTEEVTEGEITPGRSRRNKQGVDYNVRRMMLTALGKDTRKRRRDHDDDGAQLDGDAITYNFPAEQFQVHRFECVICGVHNERLSQLRAHFMSHPDYNFQFEVKPRAGCVITIKNKSSINNGSPVRLKIYQLGLPVKPLNLDEYVEGDESWVSSRLGPEDGQDVTSKLPIKAQKKLAARTKPRKKVVVPNTKQPLFDPRTKVQLVPGAEVRIPPVDDAWLIRKHRDTLADFVDVDQGEREFMQEWDAYILRKHISSEAYLPRSFLGFVKEKAAWIVASKSRSREFGKHVAILLARKVLKEVEVTEATQRLNEARERLREQPRPEEDGEKEGKPKTKSGCVACGRHVAVPEMVVCGNKACKNRLYHIGCVPGGEETVEEGTQWVCGQCSN